MGWAGENLYTFCRGYIRFGQKFADILDTLKYMYAFCISVNRAGELALSVSLCVRLLQHKPQMELAIYASNCRTM